MSGPSRGEIWQVDLNPVVGHEQGERRPALVVSVDALNHGPSGLISVVPITGTIRNIPIHVLVRRGQGGLTKDSRILCDQVRTLARERFIRRYASVDAAVMAEVEEKLRIVLGL
jgi:mRNA interferase MazF